MKLNNLLRDFPKDRGLIFCNENDKNSKIFKALKNNLNKYKKWSILIGPEGGFTETEVEKFYLFHLLFQFH